MGRRLCLRSIVRLLGLFVLVPSMTCVASAKWKENVLYSFQGGNDGATPAGGVVFDKAGNLYGATRNGGWSCPPPGCGTIFQLTPPTKGNAWTEKILFGFSGNNGAQPSGGLIIDGNGNLYGVTAYGGSGTCLLLGGDVGCGVVYELSPPTQKGGQWTYSILYNFQGGSDGQFPTGDLVFDSKRNLYGATIYGGGYGTCNAPYYLYCGTVFKLIPPNKTGGTWKEGVLHAFAGGTDGATPSGGLILDGKGAIDGTTYFGGNEAGACSGGVGGTGCGTVFELRSPAKEGALWDEKILHRFDAEDGANPAAGLIAGKNGALYGAADVGAKSGGIIFRMVASNGLWTEDILYEFSTQTYGYDPATAFFDNRGNLYGTTNADPNGDPGTVFRLRPPKRKGRAWTINVLYGFQGVPDGAFPATSLVRDQYGNLYGATQAGGNGTGCSFHGCGIVFELEPELSSGWPSVFLSRLNSSGTGQ